MGKKHQYKVIIRESLLDTFGHVNNAAYLVLFEEARWEMVYQRGFYIDTIQKTGLGPTILEINIKYYKEICLRDEIIIETECTDYARKVGTIVQTMSIGDSLCCRSEFKMGLFSLSERKLVVPTELWLCALGFQTPES